MSRIIPQSTAYEAPSPTMVWPRAAGGEVGRNFALVASASLLVAVCARFGTFPLPFTPGPLFVAEFRGFADRTHAGQPARGAGPGPLYCGRGGGVAGFCSHRAGRHGATAGAYRGYLLAYPAVAFLAGWIFEELRHSRAGVLAGALVAGTAGEALLFASGIAWLKLAAHLSFAQAAGFAVYPFFAGEALKVALAAGLASKRQYPRFRPHENQ